MRQRPVIWKPRYATRRMRERAWADADLRRQRAAAESGPNRPSGILRARWGLGYAAAGLVLAVASLVLVLSSGTWDDCAGAGMSSGEAAGGAVLLFALLATIAGAVTLPLAVTGRSNRLRALAIALIPLVAVAGVMLAAAGHPTSACSG